LKTCQSTCNLPACPCPDSAFPKLAMPALRNTAAPRRRGPQHSQQQGGKSDGGLDVVAAPSGASGSTVRRAAAKPVALAQLPGAPRSSARAGVHYGRGAVAQKVAKKTGAGHRVAGGKAVESCAWPAFAQSAQKAEAEVLSAVISLYKDELKPFGRILRKRIAERILESQGKDASIANLDALPEVDTKQVRAVCEACEVLRVDEEDGGDWSAVFKERPATFVDVYSPVDCYPEQFWLGLQAYCESTAGQDMSLPGGRYACAQALKAIQLPLLAGFSLGRICHVVQLAISQKKILGYMNGAVVPYKRSQSMMKDRCAMYGQPNNSNSNGQVNTSLLPIASLQDARKHLCEILDMGKGEVPLSNVKRLFRSRFQLELSETSFGYSKLSELLQDSNFTDICMVELRGHGYTVIQLAQKAGPKALAPGIQAALHTSGQQRVPLCANEPLSFDVDDATAEGCKDGRDGLVTCSVQHTFLQYKLPQTPLPGPKRRAQSLPKDMGRSEWPLGEEASALTARAPKSASDLLPKSSDNGRGSANRSGSDRKRSDSGSGTGLSGQVSFGHSRLSSQSTSIGNDWLLSSQSTSAGNDWLLSSQATMVADHADDAMGFMKAKGDSSELRANFCPNEPLEIQDSDMFWGETTGTSAQPPHALRAPVPTVPSGCAAHFSTAFSSFGDSSFHAIGSESAGHRVTFCPDEPLGFDEERSSLPNLSRALVPPSPAMTPSPLPFYSYSGTSLDELGCRQSGPTQWSRPLISSSPPQASPSMGLAPMQASSSMGFTTAPSNSQLGCPSQLGCAGTYTTQPSAQSGTFGSFGNIATYSPRQNLQAGYVIRLGEHL